MYKHVEKGGGKRPDYDIALVRLNYPVFDDESKLGILNVSVPQCHCVYLCYTYFLTQLFVYFNKLIYWNVCAFVSISLILLIPASSDTVESEGGR
jgi:hypothetical protein